MDLKYYAKVAIGTTAALLFGSVLMRVMDEEHEFRSGPTSFSYKERKERIAKGDTSNWFGDQYFINKDGLAIYWRRWLPTPIAQPNVKALVVISHGLGEHSDRYNYLANLLTKEGYAVYALDHQGHGRSEGTRKHAKWFGDLVADVHQLTELAKANHPTVKKVFLLGHSMGALITIHSAHKAPRLYDGIVVSAPPLKVELDPVTDKVGPILGSLFPKLPGVALPLETLSRDPSVVDRYFNDPLNDLSMGTLRLVSELVKSIKEAQQFSKDFDIPYLLMHGTADQMCMYDGSKEFHEKSASKDKTFKTYEGAYHELYNEPDKHENAIPHTLEWLRERVNKN